MRIVTALEQSGRHKFKVFIDEEYAFTLSEQDLNMLKLSEGSSLSDIQYDNIMKDIVIRRAKQKALDLLEASDKSEYELRLKLKQSGFTDDITDIAVSYVKGYGYIDDERFASNYIRNYIDIKSRQNIRTALLSKGIDSQTVEDAFYLIEDELGIDSDKKELDKAVILLKKKLKNASLDDLTVRRKIEGYMFRQGFKSEVVRKAIEQVMLEADGCDELDSVI